jgi:SIR2-like domain
LRKECKMPTSVTRALIRFFKEAQFPILFLGAGVSARAGLPSWKKFVEQLAEGLRSTDSLTTQQMLECVASGDYTLAVEYFRLSRKMLEGNKRDLLSRLLSGYDHSKISSVAKLPARACLTTNFDRSILDAVAESRGKAPRDYRLGDASFNRAQWEENLFVARIHGAVEVPDGMVLSEAQFKAMLNDETYLDLLRTCFVQRNVIFLGFSFYDPAIRFVFEELNRRFGPASPGRHLALLPADAVSDFIQKANRLNIEIATYSPEDNHAELWNEIDAFVLPKAGLTKAVVRPPVSPFEFTRRYLAACYARARAQGSSVALREAVAEGIISAILQDAAPKPISLSELSERIRLAIGLRGREAETIADAATRSLTDVGLCRRVKDSGGRESRVFWAGNASETTNLDSAIEVLTNSVRNRAYLQEGWKPDAKATDAITAFFNHLITRRGWDLGAAFASGRAPEIVAVSSLLADSARGLPAFDLERLQRICDSMLQKPSDDEATILREVGRVSFALELAFQTPRTVLLQQAILPRFIYFDASVLMPAIVEGHPYSQVYSDAIKRLGEAAAASALELRKRVASVYLNEIITHRRNAQDYANEFGSDFADYARMDAIYHGVTNVNVFVGAFANTYERAPMPFAEFLSRVAPYQTEADLKKWLLAKGFEVIDAVKGNKYAAIYSRLEKAYADGLSRGKRPILIEHDALQLSILDEDMQRGEKSLFITADRALHTATSDGPFAHLTGMMLSHVALVQFIDLLLGGVNDSVGVTELLWSARISDRAHAVRSYFTTRGLEQYDEAMALEMPGIVEKFAELASRELSRTGADLEADDPKLRAAALRNLGGLEKDYLASMSAAVDKLRAQLEGAPD